MKLTLSALSLDNEPLSQPIVAQFDSQGGTIGRGERNLMVLPDPERHISREHARISDDGRNGYRITNLSSANAVTVAGRSLGQGESAPIRHRDLVRIGSFLLEARDDSADEPDNRTIPHGRPAGAADPGLNALLGGLGGEPGMRMPDPVAPAVVKPPAQINTATAQDDPWFAITPAAGPLPARTPARPGNSKSTPEDDWAAFFPPGPGPGATPAKSPAPAWPAPTPLTASGDDWLPPAQGKSPFDFGSPAFEPAPSPRSFDSITPISQDAFPDLLSADSSGNAFDLGSFMDTPLPGSSSSTPNGSSPAELMPGLGAAATPLNRISSTGLPPAQPLHSAFAPAAGIQTPAPAPFAPPLFEADGALTASPATLRPSPGGGSAQPAFERPASARAGTPPVSVPVPAPVAAWAINKDVQATSASPSLAAVEHGRLEVSIPPPVQPSPPAQTTAPSSAHSGAVDAHALWRAFCTGADIQLKLPDGVSPELMHVIGQLMRNSIEGTLKMMAVRALTRQELRADVTMFQAQNNNPLKFSPDAQAALESLLQPPARGFMQGPAAVTDAMHDLVGHAIGTMAGTRAALEGVLQRFAPTVLEGKLGGNTMRDAFVPMVRRSRLWELYLQHFEAIRMEAQEDFHTLFGRAFLAAYEQQLDELYEQQRQRRTASRAKAATDQP